MVMPLLWFKCFLYTRSCGSVVPVQWSDGLASFWPEFPIWSVLKPSRFFSLATCFYFHLLFSLLSYFVLTLNRHHLSTLRSELLVTRRSVCIEIAHILFFFLRQYIDLSLLVKLSDDFFFFDNCSSVMMLDEWFYFFWLDNAFGRSSFLQSSWIKIIHAFLNE